MSSSCQTSSEMYTGWTTIKGKVIFLNFWATWCGPCRNEMPEIQKLYEEYAAQGEAAEVAVIGVAGPGMGGEGSKEEITAFMEENGYTYPVLMDETGDMFSYYGISAFPYYVHDRQGRKCVRLCERTADGGYHEEHH